MCHCDSVCSCATLECWRLSESGEKDMPSGQHLRNLLKGTYNIVYKREGGIGGERERERERDKKGMENLFPTFPQIQDNCSFTTDDCFCCKVNSHLIIYNILFISPMSFTVAFRFSKLPNSATFRSEKQRCS